MKKNISTGYPITSPFNVTILSPLIISKNLELSDAFRGYSRDGFRVMSRLYKIYNEYRKFCDNKSKEAKILINRFSSSLHFIIFIMFNIFFLYHISSRFTQTLVGFYSYD